MSIQKPISVAKVGGMYFGGKEITVSGQAPEDVPLPGGGTQTITRNGDFCFGQMYAQYVLLAEPKARYPMLLWHGGGLNGSNWEDTPDGRPGWQWFFLNQGHSVYVSDAAERGRATWPRFPDIMPGYPEFRDKGRAWTWFRIGPSYTTDPAGRVAYPESKFPAAGFDILAKQTNPRWRQSEAMVEQAYAEYLGHFPQGCVITGHSQGGHFAVRALTRFPETVKALVLLEPYFQKNTLEHLDVAALRGVPQIIIWGDYLDSDQAWVNQRNTTQRYADTLNAAGCDITVLDLPALGIKGNSHMLHNDVNSDQIAGMAQRWMSERGLMR